MKKKLIIGVVVVIVVLGAAFAYLNYRNYTLSPRGSAQLANAGLDISVSYCRPSVRGRVIFGTKDQGALQPYGAYWRLGANESTEITFNKDVTFNGEPLKAGTYRVYAHPGDETFEIVVNTELGRWGAFEPDHAMDILKTKVAAEKVGTSLEQFTINLTPAENGIDMSFEWADVKVVIPVKGQ